MKGQGILFSRKSDDWATPIDLLNKINHEFGFLFDPCPLNCTWDALEIDWDKCNFINPPYSNIKEFVKKGTNEIIKENARCNVWLLPARTDTRWFHEYFYNKNGVEIRFIKGRLKFGGGQNSAPFPSMLVIQKAVN